MKTQTQISGAQQPGVVLHREPDSAHLNTLQSQRCHLLFESLALRSFASDHNQHSWQTLRSVIPRRLADGVEDDQRFDKLKKNLHRCSNWST